MLSHQNSTAWTASGWARPDFQPFFASSALRRSWTGSIRSPPFAQIDQKNVNHPCGYFMPPTNPHLTLRSAAPTFIHLIEFSWMGCGMYPTLSSTCWAVAGTARLTPSARLPPPTVLRKVRRLISSPPLLLREEGSSLAGSAARPPSRRECGLPSLHCQDGKALS